MLLIGLSLAETPAILGEDRLPDFSWAGHESGDLPELAATSDVRDFGAISDDGLDDHGAFQLALDEGGVVWVPEGIWQIEGVLRIEHSGTVLKGAGSESVLVFPYSLEDLEGEAVQWSWNGGLIWAKGPGLGASLTTTGEALRRDDRLSVQATDGLGAGDVVVLELTDDDDRTLGYHLHNDQDEPGDCDYQLPLKLRVPLRVVSVEGDVLAFEPPLRHDVRAEWSPTLYALDPLADIGVEHLRLHFPDIEYAGHLDEPGFNGVFFQEGVVDSWVRDVEIRNADNGVLVDTLTRDITVRGVTFTGRDGHHGLNIAHSYDGLYEELLYEANFVHGTTVDHRAAGNVFHRIQVGEDRVVHLDHHRDSPFENLYTAIRGDVDLINGGSTCAGPPGGARNTFWGLETPLWPPYWKHVQTNLIGPSMDVDVRTQDQEWIEVLDVVEPRNLFLWQRAQRLGEDYEDSGLEEPVEEPVRETCGCRAGPFAGVVLLPLLLRRRRRASPPA